MILLVDKSFNPVRFITRRRALKLEYLSKANFVMEEEVMQLRNHSFLYKTSVKYAKRRVFLRDQDICQYCGRVCSKNNKTVDHVLPQSRGGEDSFTNCVTSCKRCNNNRKKDRTPAEAGLRLLRKPKQPDYYTLMSAKDSLGIMSKFDSWMNSMCGTAVS
jgi:5-methylcytosine-specific restriction endonuclease McrA